MTTEQIISSLEKSRAELAIMFMNAMSESMMKQCEEAIASIDRRLERERTKLIATPLAERIANRKAPTCDECGAPNAGYPIHGGEMIVCVECT